MNLFEVGQPVENCMPCMRASLEISVKKTIHLTLERVQHDRSARASANSFEDGKLNARCLTSNRLMFPQERNRFSENAEQCYCVYFRTRHMLKNAT